MFAVPRAPHRVHGDEEAGARARGWDGSRADAAVGAPLYCTKLGSTARGPRCNGHLAAPRLCSHGSGLRGERPTVLRTRLGWGPRPPQRPTDPWRARCCFSPRLNRKGEICDSSLISPGGLLHFSGPCAAGIPISMRSRSPSTLFGGSGRQASVCPPWRKFFPFTLTGMSSYKYRVCVGRAVFVNSGSATARTGTAPGAFRVVRSASMIGLALGSARHILRRAWLPLSSSRALWPSQLAPSPLPPSPSRYRFPAPSPATIGGLQWAAPTPLGNGGEGRTLLMHEVKCVSTF